MAPNVHNSLAIQKKHVASMYRFVGREWPRVLKRRYITARTTASSIPPPLSPKAGNHLWLRWAVCQFRSLRHRYTAT